jgi:hypothetical protein
MAEYRTPYLIDSHCHLDLQPFDADRAEVVARGAAAGVTLWVTLDRPRPVPTGIGFGRTA